MALPKKNRLHAQKDFDNIFKNGKASRGHFLLIKYIKASNREPRIGFITPAKVARKAVIRNRIRRILAKTTQQNLSLIKKDMVVLLLKTPMSKKDERELLSEELNSLILKTNEQDLN